MPETCRRKMSFSEQHLALGRRADHEEDGFKMEDWMDLKTGTK